MVDVAGAVVPLTANVNIFGVVLDRHLNFTTHVQSLCKSVNYHIRGLRYIRTSLTTDMARTVAARWSTRVLTTPTLCYTTLLRRKYIAKLQRAQNAIARIVMLYEEERNEHIRLVVQQLHWLPISFRVDYKIATHVYKVLNTDYLRQSVHFYIPSRHLRSTPTTLD